MKTVFFNVDTQVDFIDEDGKLAIPDAVMIRNNLKTLTRTAADMGWVVVNTADWHKPTDSEFSDDPDYARTFPSHCVEMTPGALFIPETQPTRSPLTFHPDSLYEYIVGMLMEHDGDVIILKNRFDVFAGNPLTNAIITNISPERAVVYGVASNVCVDFVLGGLLRYQKSPFGSKLSEIVAVTDAMKGINCDDAKVYKKWLEQGILLQTTKEVIAPTLIG